jgi:hypothetical protein
MPQDQVGLRGMASLNARARKYVRGIGKKVLNC